MSTDDRTEREPTEQASDGTIQELPKKVIDADDAEAVKGGAVFGALPAVQQPAPSQQQKIFTGGI